MRRAAHVDERHSGAGLAGDGEAGLERFSRAGGAVGRNDDALSVHARSIDWRGRGRIRLGTDLPVENPQHASGATPMAGGLVAARVR